MNFRNVKETINSSTDKKKIVVEHASTGSDKIRFFLDETWYVTACEFEENRYMTIIQHEPMAMMENYLEQLCYSNNLKQINRRLDIIIDIALALLCFSIMIVVDNFFFSVFMANAVIFLIYLRHNLVRKLALTPENIRSKHSAEHKMVNFISKNQRLPRNWEELRKASRFSNRCSSNIDIIIAERSFVTITIAIIGALLVHCIAKLVLVNFSVFFWFVFDLIIYTLFLAIMLKYRDRGVVKSLINCSISVLMRVNQLSVTKRKVADSDLILAYLAGRRWMLMKYPEFYTEEDEKFWRENLIDICTEWY